MTEGRMSANAFETLLREIDQYKRVRDGIAPARPVSGGAVVGRHVPCGAPIRKALVTPARPVKSISEALAELRELGAKSREMAKSLQARSEAIDRQLARDRASAVINSVAAKTSEAARAGRLTAHEAATLTVMIGRARAALGG